MESFTTPGIEFVGEQDGVPERRLKASLAAILSGHRSVRRAWLAQARYDGDVETVVLALLTDTGQDDEELVGKVGEAFASIFNAAAWLDTVFPDSEHAAAVAKVCRPFYVRGETTRWSWQGIEDSIRGKAQQLRRKLG